MLQRAVFLFNGAFLHLLSVLCNNQTKSMDMTLSHIQLLYLHVAVIKA
jgi:hypothetical protein